MNTRSFIRLTLALGAVAAGIAAAVAFARRLREGPCEEQDAAELDELTATGSQPTPETDGRKSASLG